MRGKEIPFDEGDAVNRKAPSIWVGIPWIQMGTVGTGQVQATYVTHVDGGSAGGLQGLQRCHQADVPSH